MNDEERLLEWQAENPWFGLLQPEADALMSVSAAAFHDRAVEKGMHPGGSEYLDYIDALMRLAFPEYEWPD